MSVLNPLNWSAIAAEAIDNQNPKYRMGKAELKSAAIKLQMVSGAGVVVGVVALFFGMTKGSMILVWVGTPILYVFYNMYRISENVQAMSENLNQFLQNPIASKVTGGAPRPDLDKIGEYLKKNTFCFEMFINFAITHVKTRTGL